MEVGSDPRIARSATHGDDRQSLWWPRLVFSANCYADPRLLFIYLCFLISFLGHIWLDSCFVNAGKVGVAPWPDANTKLCPAFLFPDQSIENAATFSRPVSNILPRFDADRADRVAPVSWLKSEH